MHRVAIYGAGSWGTALAQSLATHGYQVILWARDRHHIDSLKEHRENQRYLPGVILDSNIHCTSDITATAGASMKVIAIPTQAQRAFLEEHQVLFSDQSILVNVAKGLEASTGKRLSTVYQEVLKDVEHRYVVLYGPTHAEEVGFNMPSAIVAAALDEKVAEEVQKVFMNPDLRVYTSDDLMGVELGGALKNIIALAIGMTIGLGYGDNARAALMTRGLAEISRLGVALGANPITFLGLTGVGDLIVTCMSEHSRNRTAGIHLGEGMSLDTVLGTMGMVVEGVPTTKAAHALAQEKDISMPIVEHMYDVLFQEANVKDAADDLMRRSRKSEKEEFLCE